MKISIKLSVLLMSLAVLSCKQLGDDLLTVDAPSSSSEAVIFSNPDLAKGAVDGIKVPMAETNSYRGRWIPFYGMNTDTEWLNSSESISNDNADLVVYDPKPNNSQMNTA